MMVPRGTALACALALMAVVVAEEGAPCPPASGTVCQGSDTCCADAFSKTGYGCCTGLGPNAVCCRTPLPSGLDRNYCCPAGSQCSSAGCTPIRPVYSCGPSQGHNCTVDFVCAPGPKDWSPTALPHNVVVMGDSVSIGWTPVLASVLANSSFATVVHTPDSGDGGARSTTNGVVCSQYLLHTSTLKPLPLSASDFFLFNFGLHDYNLGMTGLANYTAQLQSIVSTLQQTVKARLIWVATTPAHNVAAQFVGSSANAVVVELNKAAAGIMTRAGIPTIDLYSPIMAKCGPVPFADSGPSSCPLCAPDCAKLAVHYTPAGYSFIADIVAARLKALAASAR